VGELTTKVSRTLVAKEAARLLYLKFVDEYKEAKEKAAESLGISVLPSNIEIAYEVDKLADDFEGKSRSELLIRLRKKAFEVMRILNNFHPRLIGSVWRGTCHRSSDIDITVFSADSDAVVETLRENGYQKMRTEWTSKSERGEVNSFFHIYLSLTSLDEVEVVVNDPKRLEEKEICEIYGDQKKGLTISQLSDVLKKDPIKKFVPRKRNYIVDRY
jgi:predicted nucleotidyltransferase